MRDGNTEGMQPFDLEFERLVRNGTISRDIALQYATNPTNLALELSDLEFEAEEKKQAEQEATTDADDDFGAEAFGDDVFADETSDSATE
jgi:Tfp pilus assembly ATPase PilU